MINVGIVGIGFMGMIHNHTHRRGNVRLRIALFLAILGDRWAAAFQFVIVS